MPKEESISKHSHGGKSMKIPSTIYADMDSVLEEISTCHNNLEKLSTTKKNKHTASGYSCLHIFHLIQQKINLIIIEAKIARKKNL